MHPYFHSIVSRSSLRSLKSCRSAARAFIGAKEGQGIRLRTVADDPGNQEHGLHPGYSYSLQCTHFPHVSHAGPCPRNEHPPHLRHTLKLYENIPRVQVIVRGEDLGAASVTRAALAPAVAWVDGMHTCI